MASQMKGQWDDVQYTVYNLPTSDLDVMQQEVKCITRLHPTGQRWGDKVKWDYENRQWGGDKTPPLMASTNAMDMEEGDAITKMIIDRTKAKVERRQRRIALRGWDLDAHNIPRPLSIPLPENQEKGDAPFEWLAMAMSSLVISDYEELDERCIRRKESIKSWIGSPWFGSKSDKLETRAKIPSTSTTAFMQCTTEELDQLDRPHRWRMKGREDAQASAILPMVYGITPQESPADTDKESRKRGTPQMDQTIIEKGRDWTSSAQEVITEPLAQFTQNILGSSVITVRPKMMSAQTKTTSNQEPIQPNFYLPDEKGSRLSEFHQIKTGEKNPKGNPAMLIVL